ncbi:hypothetical protein GCM10009416_09010 [Craurococcus roseus]|uniref:Uncharacterized protein n=1 Tax=Craurococcus roseus TaxID=77585 RepID=A0ABN1ES89_9PROT
MQGPSSRRSLAGAALVAACACLAAGPSPAEEAAELRGFRIGMAVSDLPSEGYTGFACGARPETALDGWGGFRACPPDPATGLREVRFRYDDAANPLARLHDRYAGTKVGGQPVLLSLLIGEGARVEGLRIRTDPGARLFERKRAMLFGEQVKNRYGEEGWTCTDAAPEAGEEPVGGVFIKEHCDKTTADRRFSLDRWLYRRAGEDLRRFSGGTAVTILRRGG